MRCQIRDPYEHENRLFVQLSLDNLHKRGLLSGVQAKSR